MKQITLLDGALGTGLWNLSDEKLPSWQFNLDKPEIVESLYRQYIAAGSEIICTNTFAVNRMAMKGYEDRVDEAARTATRLAKKATAGTNVRVACDVGPLTELLEPYGDLEEDEAEEIFMQQIAPCIEEGADLIFLETFMDLALLKVAMRVASRYDVPLFCSMSFLKVGKTIMGNSIADMVAAMAEYKVAAFGLNCSLEPKEAMPLLEEFRKCTDAALIFKPNAGMPTMKNGVAVPGKACAAFVEEILPAKEIGATYLGGCCGSDPSYIKALADALG